MVLDFARRNGVPQHVGRCGLRNLPTSARTAAKGWGHPDRSGMTAAALRSICATMMQGDATVFLSFVNASSNMLGFAVNMLQLESFGDFGRMARPTSANGGRHLAGTAARPGWFPGSAASMGTASSPMSLRRSSPRQYESRRPTVACGCASPAWTRRRLPVAVGGAGGRGPRGRVAGGVPPRLGSSAGVGPVGSGRTITGAALGTIGVRIPRCHPETIRLIEIVRV